MTKTIVQQNILAGSFYNPSRGQLAFGAVLLEMIVWMAEKPNCEYELIVGCDSPSSSEPFFPLAIVLLRKGQGGRFFLKKVEYQRRFFNWKQRILQEVLLSCELALSLREELLRKAALMPRSVAYDFKYIHADVGSSGATKDMIKEVTGIIQGNGFEPCIKPNSYAASNVADRYT